MTTLTPAHLHEAFEALDSWEDRYRYIIDLGRRLEPLDDADRTEANRVRGCQSTVWLVARPHPDDPARLHFTADSDAHIVRGLICIVLTLLNDRTPEAILAADVHETFDRIDLLAHLSPTRSNGLHALIKRTRALAAEHANGDRSA